MSRVGYRELLLGAQAKRVQHKNSAYDAISDSPINISEIVENNNKRRYNNFALIQFIIFTVSQCVELSPRFMNCTCKYTTTSRECPLYFISLPFRVLFADIVNFTPLTASMQPKQLVATLNQLFSRFDQLALVHCII